MREPSSPCPRVGRLGFANGAFLTWTCPSLGEDLAPTGWENTATLKIGQKYIKNTKKKTIFGIFCIFLPYVASGGVSLFCRGPSFSLVRPALFLFVLFRTLGFFSIFQGYSLGPAKT